MLSQIIQLYFIEIWIKNIFDTNQILFDTRYSVLITNVLVWIVIPDSCLIQSNRIIKSILIKIGPIHI